MEETGPRSGSRRGGRAPAPGPVPLSAPGSTPNTRFCILCISIFNMYKRVWFHPLFLVEVERLSWYLYCFFLNKKKKKKMPPSPFKNTNADPVYPSRSEMMNGTRGPSARATLWMSPLTRYQLSCIRHFC